MTSEQRHAVTLLLVLVCLTLAATLVAPLAVLSGTVAMETGHRCASLRHRLAVDSVLALLPRLVHEDERVADDLMRSNRARLALDLHDLHVDILLQDDTAKLPIPQLAEGAAGHLTAALRALTAQAVLPPLALRLLPATADAAAPNVRWTGCLEDLFAEPTDGALYGTPGSPPSWAQYISPAGHMVHVDRAPPAVLEAALVDLRPGLGLQLARTRTQQPRANIDELLAALELPDAVRTEARRRLTARTDRYSLLVRTRLGSDVRQHYVVCSASDPPVVVLDWEVAP